MLKLKHFLWFCSLTTGGILISFATFMQSLWQGLTIWPYYERTQFYINELKFAPLRELFNGNRTILFTFCGIWAFFVVASIISSGMLVYSTMNVSLSLKILLLCLIKP